jgi:hypothetical protein
MIIIPIAPINPKKYAYKDPKIEEEKKIISIHYDDEKYKTTEKKKYKDFPITKKSQ